MNKGILLKRKLTKRERKQAFSPKTTEKIVQAMKSTIKDSRVRMENVVLLTR